MGRGETMITFVSYLAVGAVCLILGYAFRGKEHAAIVKAIAEAQKIPVVGGIFGKTVTQSQK
jgi:hypothetical protein